MVSGINYKYSRCHAITILTASILLLSYEPPVPVDLAGTTNAANDDATLCGINEYVLSHVCESCPTGTLNQAGDDASAAETSCQTDPCIGVNCQENEICTPNWDNETGQLTSLGYTCKCEDGYSRPYQSNCIRSGPSRLFLLATIASPTDFISPQSAVVALLFVI